MSRLMQGILGAVSAVALTLGAGGAVAADEAGAGKEPIRFALLQDFTKVYTFLTGEYNQGQLDYIKMVNANGGIDGHPIEPIVQDTGNEPQRGLEAYERARGNGAVLVDFLSTPISRAAVKRVLEDQMVMITPLHGRGDASDGKTFPFVFPLLPTYWSQAALLMDYIKTHEGGLKGKKIAFVYLDSPYGREPLPILETLTEREGFTLKTFAYPSPGTEQSATWTDVRRFRPDFVLLWGAGGSQQVSTREAVRNGIKPEQLLSVVWMAITDISAVGPERMKGVKRFEAVAPGRDHPVIKEIIAKVIEPGHGSGEEAKVGTSYYNIGAATMAVATEAARLALDTFGEPLTSDKLRQGFELIQGFDAQGMMPPVSYTAEDHQGGGKGRVSHWDGEKWIALTDWTSGYQDVVRAEIEKDAKAFRDDGK